MQGNMNYEQLFNKVMNAWNNEIIGYSSSTTITHETIMTMGIISRRFKQLAKEYGSKNQWETAWNYMIEEIKLLKEECEIYKEKYNRYYFNPVLCKVFKKKANYYSTASALSTMLFVKIESLLFHCTS